MSTRLVILGLLRERKLYGYEIKHIIEEHMGDWTSIAFGSIYFALGKLTEEGLLEKVAVEKYGNRPSRSVYEITEKGTEEFYRLVREVWRNPQRQYYTMDIALFFMSTLPAAEVTGYIEEQIKSLEGALMHILRHREETLSDEHVPRFAAAVFDHSHVHIKAELAWLQDLKEKIEKGDYP